MPILGDAESHGPIRPAPSTTSGRVLAPDRGRLRWRAIVRVGPKLDASRGQQPLAWHLVGCVEPRRPDSHCDVGRLLIETVLFLPLLLLCSVHAVHARRS